MQRCRSAELDLRPFQVADLGRPKSMPVGDEDQGRVTMAVASFAGGADEPPKPDPVAVLITAATPIWKLIVMRRGRGWSEKYPA
jgi:hypothetical protein